MCLTRTLKLTSVAKRWTGSVNECKIRNFINNIVTQKLFWRNFCLLCQIFKPFCVHSWNIAGGVWFVVKALDKTAHLSRKFRCFFFNLPVYWPAGPKRIMDSSGLVSSYWGKNVLKFEVISRHHFMLELIKGKSLNALKWNKRVRKSRKSISQ